MTAQPTSPAPLSHVGKYEIIRMIGSGGSGIVYEALHPELKKRVAVKTLHPKLAESPEERRRFLREGEAASRIRHPNVVDITDVGEHEGQPFLVMEYLEGHDLKAYLQMRGALPLVEAVNLMLPVIAAVGAGHQAGVLHRDLKPHNIFIASGQSKNPHPKVLDFGVSKLVDPNPGSVSWSGVEVILGTLCYMAPEQVRGVRQNDPRTDQYALALIIYECVTGSRVHGGDDQVAIIRKIAEGNIQPPSIQRPDLPPIFEAALMQALATDPEHRFVSVHEFGRAMLPFASERVALVWQAAFEPSPATLPTGPLKSTLLIDPTPPPPRETHTSGVVPPPVAPDRPRRLPLLRKLALAAVLVVVGVAVAALLARLRVEDLTLQSPAAPSSVPPPRRTAAFESLPRHPAPTPSPAAAPAVPPATPRAAAAATEAPAPIEAPVAAETQAAPAAPVAETITETPSTRAGARPPARASRRISRNVAKRAVQPDYPVGANHAPIITD